MTHRGQVEIVVGCMFSGKSEEIIRRLRREVIARRRVRVFKPVIDNRYHIEDVVSHSGQSVRAYPVEKPTDILNLLDDVDVVGIDEVQFFDPTIIEVVHRIANSGKRVIVAGLDMDYRGVPFGPVPHLLATAEYVTKLHAVCTVCGEPASMSQRISSSQDQVVVGGTDVYEARCRKHWSPEPIFGNMDPDKE